VNFVFVLHLSAFSNAKGLKYYGIMKEHYLPLSETQEQSCCHAVQRNHCTFSVTVVENNTRWNSLDCSFSSLVWSVWI